MTESVAYQRDHELRRRVNRFLQTAFSLPAEDYYGRLSSESLIGLKSALSDINNALTMQLSFGFLRWAEERLPIDATAIATIREALLRSKPGANGYDLVCLNPVAFVAEVKCNIPINGGSKYGSAQKNGILKDVAALKGGKQKAAQTAAGTLKFMVFLDLPQVRAANAHLLSSSAGLSGDLRFVRDDEAPDDPTIVYGVYANLES